MKTTTKDLVQELTGRNSAGRYDSIIARAKDNGYHDFKCTDEDIICPKMDLCNDLSVFPELADIRQAVMDGEYDESPDEEDNKEMRSWLEKDGEAGKRMINLLGL